MSHLTPEELIKSIQRMRRRDEVEVVRTHVAGSKWTDREKSTVKTAIDTRISELPEDGSDIMDVIDEKALRPDQIEAREALFKRHRGEKIRP